MTALTANTPRAFQGELREANFEVGANLEVFVGQAMIAGANGIINATPTASGDFVGFARAYADNRTGAVPYGGAARAVEVPVAVQGFVWLTVANGSNWAYSDLGATVYASDGNTFTNSAGTNNIVIGTVVNVDKALGAASGLVLVKFGF